MSAIKDNKDNLWIVIPARQGSVGFPNKNRLLFEYTALQIPEYLRKRTVVTTDDDVLKKEASAFGFIVIDRPEILATAEASTRDALDHVKEYLCMSENDVVIMLYLTFPERRFKDVEKVFDFYKDNGAKSVLCKSKVDKHPYLCLYEEPGNTGRQIIRHDMYRRQDYPKCFFVLHYVTICKVSEIDKLNKNLYNNDTLYFSIERKIDIDEPEHFEKWKKDDF